MAVRERDDSAAGRAAPYVGASQRRHEGDLTVTGRAVYTADLLPPGTAHVAIVRSPHAHATIRGVETARAAAAAGVLAVLTGEEAAELAAPIPHNLDPAGLGGNHADIRCLAVGKVVYVGQPVAAVVAETTADARAGAELVDVSYAPLPAVLDAESALLDGAPLVYEEWPSNVMIAGATADGDFEAAAAAAAGVVCGELRLQRSTSAPMETRAYLARWDERARRLTWHGTTQNPHPMRWVLATALGLAERQVHVIAPKAGGAFGAKMHGHPEEVLVAVLARRLRRPVKWVESREESLLAAGKEQVQRFRAAHDADGRVRALHVDMTADHGAAAAGPGWGMAFVAALTFPTGYDVAVCRVEYRVVVTNKSPWWGARPFGKEAPALVMERVMDLVAQATGLDPLEVRRRNWVSAARFPHTSPTGIVLDSGDYHGLVARMLERVDYLGLRAEQARLRDEGRLTGIGVGFEMLPEGADIPGALVGGFDTATVRMDPSGEVTVLTGVTNPGSGSDTAIAQIVADRLGVRVERVTVVQGDSAACPYGFGNLSSRSVVAGGGAAALAAGDVAAKLRAVAAAMLHAEPEQIVLGGGLAMRADEAGAAVPLADVAHGAYSLGYVLALSIDPTLEATRTYKPPNIRHLPDEAGRISPFASYSSCLHLSVVEVDAETGEVQPRRHVAIHDCGTMINPRLVEGQVRGGIAMGLGAALGEELVHDGDGAPLSDGFKTYLLPRAVDVPGLELGHQETPSPFTALGAKGAGESGYAGAYAAVVNAVNDAVAPLGARLDATPLSPPRVLAALRAAPAPEVGA